MRARTPLRRFAARGIVLAGGAAILAATLYKAPALFETLRTWAAVAGVAGGIALAAAVSYVALRGSARAARRLAWELTALGAALLTAETVIVATTAGVASDDPLVQRREARVHAARKQGIVADTRFRWDVVQSLRAGGQDVLPGLARGMVASSLLRDRLPPDFYPLAYASNTEIVECNEGMGFLRFRTDEYGFNNPPGLIASADIDVAVVGESLAVGHCVAPTKSAVALIRDRYPRTANFGVAGARILSELAVFREYVEPLRPPLVLWFLNTNFAEPKEEAHEPMLTRYLDPSFTQHLLHRQSEIDAAVRGVIAPLEEQRRNALARATRAGPALTDTLTLKRVRRLLSPPPAWYRPAEAPDLETFKAVMQLASSATSAWSGRLVVVILPSYSDTTGEPRSRARDDAIVAALEELDIDVVHGAELFREQPDSLGLYTLRIDNHPNERGHAVLGEAVIATLDSEANL